MKKSSSSGGYLEILKELQQVLPFNLTADVLVLKGTKNVIILMVGFPILTVWNKVIG